MAELVIRPEEIRSALNEFAESHKPAEVAVEEVRHVVFVAGDVAHAEGLPGIMVSELLTSEGGAAGLAMNLEERQISVIILGSFDGIDEGQVVRRTGEVLSAPVGDACLGRVIGPLGRSIDGLGEIEVGGRRALELQAPGVTTRKSIHEPFQTGPKAIDLMVPIGRDQRQLVIGDHQAGETAITLGTVLNQKKTWESSDPNKRVHCIYATTGQKDSTIAAMRATLEERGALEYTTVMTSPASDPAGFKYLSSYTGSAIGRHQMCQGKYVLIIFDDLSKQAEAYRAISLLLHRPPGREAYPDDVSYLHSHLLERCSKLSDELRTGSVTRLPIIETKTNDISVYILTNVISITDGQISLQSDLFNADQHPAVDVGISISRVGGATRVRAIKKVVGTPKITLAQHYSTQTFAISASGLDAAIRAQLTRGKRLMELLKQPQCTPYPVAEQTASVWAGTKGYLDDIDVSNVLPFEAVFLNHLRHNIGILNTIESTGQFTSETKEALVKAVEAFRCTFASGEQMLGAQVTKPGEEPATERAVEQLVVKKD